MNTRTRMLMALVAVVTFCLVSLEPLALARSPRGFLGPHGNSAKLTWSQSPNSNCKKLKGIRIDEFDGAGTSFGTITNGGILNGTTEDVIDFNTFSFGIPDANVVAYLSDTTINTRRGQLKTSLVSTFNFVTGVFSQWGNINPETSTGRFAGATGVIFFAGTTIGTPDVGPYKSIIVGEICLARGDNEDDGDDDN